jgi:hypothetical protein
LIVIRHEMRAQQAALLRFPADVTCGIGRE